MFEKEVVPIFSQNQGFIVFTRIEQNSMCHFKETEITLIDISSISKLTESPFRAHILFGHVQNGLG